MASQIRKNSPGIQSILVLHQGALGDFILALPSLEIIRKTFPKGRIVLWGYPRILELARKRFYADEVLSVDQKEMAPFFMDGGVLDSGLSRYIKTFDLIVVFGKDTEGTVVHHLRRICRGRVLPVGSFPPDGEKIHVTDHLLRQLSQHGFSGPGSSPRLYLNESDREWAAHFWKNRGVTAEERSRTILLHPGSGSKKKVWPRERFLSLAQTLRNRLESKIMVMIGPAEGPEVREAFEGMGPGVSILPEGLNLVELASVIDGCRFFIGNDSGISHLAASVGLPAFVVFGPTDPDVWSPRGDQVFVIHKKIHCSPCTREQWIRCEGMECLKNIDTSEMIKNLEKTGIELNILRKETEDGRKEDRRSDQIF